MSVTNHGTKTNPLYRYRTWVTTHDGVRVRISGTANIKNNKAEAIKAERAHVERAQAEVKPAANLTFKVFATAFLRDHVDAHNKPSERVAKRSILNTHLLPRWGERQLASLTTADVVDLVRSLISGGKSAKRINNVLHVVSKMFDYAVDADLVAVAPRCKLLPAAKLAKSATKIDFLEFDDYDRLVAASAVEPTWHAAILLAGSAGLRIGEVCAIRWEDIDLGANHLTVRRNVWRGIEGTPKGTSSRVVPLTPALAAALNSLRPSHGRVFSNAEGGFWTVTNVRAALKRQRKRAGLRKIGWHTLRHTFCSHLAMRGAPIVAIQALAGHTSVAVTQRYLHLAPESLIQAVRLLSRPVLDVTCQLVANEKEDAA